MTKILDTSDADTLRRLFEEEGTFLSLAERGFHDFEVEVGGNGLPCVRILAHKRQRRWLLLEASITEYTLQPQFFRARGYEIDRPVGLALAYWLREEDPTASFARDRPPLPLQRHPGLGVLRSAFHVLSRVARDRGLDGVACVPKFFHDAVIFFRSRLFLFLAGEEQGRFEALLRDLDPLPLALASTQVTCGSVSDFSGAPVIWAPGLQVCPLTPLLTAYFHSPEYAASVRAACKNSRFVRTATSLPPSAAILTNGN
jgi:hypothetical protein